MLQQPIVRDARRSRRPIYWRRGTFAVNAPRRDIASARARLFLPTQVAQRPHLGAQVGTRGRFERLPGLPHSPWDITLSTGGCCLAVPLFRSLFYRFTVADGSLFESYRTACSAAWHVGLIRWKLREQGR